VAVDDEVFGNDVVMLMQACSAAFGDRILARVRAECGDAVRFNDGYVFQHLVGGPLSISELAARLDVSQQAASKQVADLCSRDLVAVRADPADGRAKLVELSVRGWRAVDTARVARADLGAEIAELLGPRRAAATLAALRAISDQTGAVEHMANRRLRPEADR
jgi:DNA-binding MarR family transcriptional regulator